MDKLRKFFQNKLNLVISVVILIVIILVVCIVIILKEPGNMLFSGTVDDSKFKDEYESLNGKISEDNREYPEVKLPSSNLIKYSTIDDVLNVFKSRSDAVVYFGYSTCLYCRNAIQVLIDTAVDTELDEMLYIDIEDYWDVMELDENDKVVTVKEPHEKYYELLNTLGNELIVDYVLESDTGKKIETGKKRINYPLVIFITDGSVAGYNIGTLFSQDDPYVEMDDAQKLGLSQIYRYGINDVVTGKKNKGLLK